MTLSKGFGNGLNPFTAKKPHELGQRVGGDVLLFSGIGAVSKIRALGAVGEAAEGFDLNNVRYTPNVLSQMSKGSPGSMTPDFHGFPRIADNYGRLGKVEKITGGGGIVRTRVRIPGEYKGYEGHFEYLIEPDGVTVNHRVFMKEKD